MKTTYPLNALQTEIVGCPIKNTHMRLGQAHRLWHQALSVYDDPEGFMANVNSLVESLRNVTFVLQNEHSSIPDFTPWYESWRARMRDDPIMSWLHDARTTIVHQADLELKSTAKAVVHTNLDLIQLSTDVPPWLTTEEISLGIASTLPEPFKCNKKDLVLSVVRAWIVPGMPGQELLDTLAQAYGFLSDLVKEAHHPRSTA